MVDRLLDISEKEFERCVKRLVAQKFEALRALPADVAEVPWIGGKFDPHEPWEQHADRVIKALHARRWFEGEAPPWGQPLPLSEKDCYMLINEGGHGSGYRHRPRLDMD
jgi:hypothetical protein